MSALRVVSMGLGPIGLAAAELARSKSSLEVVGAVDIDPTIAGRDLGALFGDPAPFGCTVSNDLIATLSETKPDVVIHCTASFIPKILDQCLAAVEAGVNLVSSTEELLWPRLQHPELADRIDRAATAAGVSVLGTGVNPGFVMDTLAAFSTAVCHDVEHVTCRRRVDASTRRGPFQRKIGAGLAESEFRKLVAQGKLGHIGLRESIALLGAALGFELDEITQTVDPVVAKSAQATEFVSIERGQVAGIDNQGVGKRSGETRIEMDLAMYVGAPEDFDEVIVTGKPPMHLRVEGGVSGDLATAAMLVNTVPIVAAAAPGLRTMLDVPIAHVVS